MNGKRAKERARAQRAYEERKAKLADWKPPEVIVDDNVPAFLRGDAGFAMHIKNCSAHDMLYGNGDIPQIATFHRDGQPLCRVMCNVPNRDEGLYAVQLGCAYWSPDLVVLVSDAHAVDERWFDEKGRKPDPFELQHLCDNEGACELGLTTDVLAITAMPKSLLATATALPYHINKKAREAHWQPVEPPFSMDPEVDPESDGRVMSGIVPNTMRAAMEAPGMLELMAQQAAEAGLSYPEWVARQIGDPGFSQATEEEYRFQMDMAGLNFLTAADYQVLWARRDDEYNARVDTWLAGAGFEGRDGMFKAGMAGSPVIRGVAQAARHDAEAKWKETRERELAVAAERRAARGE